MAADCAATMPFATVEETADEEKEPLLVRLVTVGPPPAEESIAWDRR